MPFFRWVYSILFFSLILSQAYSQLDIDSLTKALNKQSTDTTSINFAIRNGFLYRKTNLEASIICFKYAVQQSQKIENKYFISKSKVALGSTYNVIGDYPNAAINLIESLRLAEEIDNKEMIMKCFLTLGNMYSYNQQISLANDMYLKALKLTETVGSEIDKATIYNNIGALLYRESNLNSDKLRVSISYFLKSLHIVEKTGNQDELIGKYNNLGLLYADFAKPDSALYYLAKAKKLIDLNSNPDDLTTYYNYLGRVYTDTREFDKAEKACLSSIEQSYILQDREWIYEGYLSLAGVYESKGDFEKAFNYFRKYSFLKDSVANEANFAIASDIKNKFEREKKEIELNQLKTEQSKNKIFNIALILVSILTVISGIMMYSRFKIKSVSENKLKIQNEIISQKNKDITDSIVYARKIQRSILPSEKFMDKEIKRLSKEEKS